MSVIDKIQGTQGKAPETPATPPQEGKSEEEKKPATLEQVIGSTGQEDPTDEKPKADQHKDAVITSLKRELRESKKERTELKELVTDLANMMQAEKKATLSDAKIKAFAEKRGVDPESIRELTELLRDEDVQPQSKKATVSKTQSKADEDEEDEDEEEFEVPKKLNKARLTTAVNKMVDDFLDDMPEYADIVDAETIKEMMIANPQKYATKTMSEIVEKIYGNAIKGKGGIEKIKGQNRDTTKKTTGRLSSKEFSQIKDDPEAMKDYKQGLMARVQKYGLN